MQTIKDEPKVRVKGETRVSPAQPSMGRKFLLLFSKRSASLLLQRLERFHPDWK
jgi:hypothetical protein